MLTTPTALTGHNAAEVIALSEPILLRARLEIGSRRPFHFANFPVDHQGYLRKTQVDYTAGSIGYRNGYTVVHFPSHFRTSHMSLLYPVTSVPNAVSSRQYDPTVPELQYRHPCLTP